ncbi:MAG: DUF2461 domain-containing protein [Gammaproteobacteria bacterium]
MTTRYFSNGTFKFLKELENNNNRDWFNENKQRYEDEVRSPSLRFVEDMSEVLPSLSPRFRAIPKKVGGSLMRIYRDARFSKDKTPYKINIGITIRHESAKDVHAPCYFIHLSNEQCFIGLGIWRPESPTLRKIRECIDENPRAWLVAKNDPEFSTNFRPGIDTLKNPPRGFNKDHPLIEDLKRKSFTAIHDMKKSEMTSKDLLENTVNILSTGAPFIRYLCYAVELPFD